MKRFLKKILIIFCIILLVPAALFLFRNKILTSVIEKSGEKIFQAKVDVENLDLDLFDMALRIGSIHVADKDKTMENLFETGSCDISLRLLPMIKKEIIIDNMSVDQIKTGTKRLTDGKIIIKKEEKKDKEPTWIENYAKEQIEKEKNNIPILDPAIFNDKIDVEKLLAKAEFITPVKIKEADAYYKSREVFWKNKIQERNYENRVNDLQKNVKTVEKCKFKNIASTTDCLNEISTIRKQVKSIKKDIKEDRRSFKKDIAKIKYYKNNLPLWVEQDKKRASDLIPFNKKNLGNIALMLFGDRATGLITTSIGYISNLRKLKNNNENDPGKSNVNSQDKNPMKKKASKKILIWVKRTKVTGLINGLTFSGEIKDLTNNQTRTGHPLVFNISGKKSGVGDLKVIGEADYIGKNSIEKINLIAKDLPVKDIKLSSSPVLPQTLAKGTADIKADLNCEEKSVKGKVNFNINDTVFNYEKDTEKNNGALAGIVRTITPKLNKIEILSGFSINENGLKLNIKSNIDNIISSELSNILKGEVKSAKNRLNKKVSAILSGEKKEFNKNTDSYEKNNNSRFKIINDKISREEKKLDDKKAEIQKKINKKTKNLQKKLFKKFKI